jgi:hypothetical protein
VIGRIVTRETAPVAWRLALVGAAAALLAAEATIPWELPPGFVPAPGPASAQAMRAPAPTPGSHDAITKHPLFYASRQPWVAPAAPPPPAVPAEGPGPLADYTLVGMVISGGTRTAIVRPRGGASVLLAEGDTLNGWTLRRIGAAGLHFEAGGQTIDITFPKSRQDGH